MKKTDRTYRKRTQRDYIMGFKLAVVSQVEKGDMTYKEAQRAYGIQGRSTVLMWLRRYGNLEWSKPKSRIMKTPKVKETPAQSIKRLERQLSDEQLKNKLLNRMIDISDQEDGTVIRKKYSPEQSDLSEE